MKRPDPQKVNPYDSKGYKRTRKNNNLPRPRNVNPYDTKSVNRARKNKEI